MKNKPKKRILTLLAAAMLCMAAFPLTAYAGGGEEIPEEIMETPEPVAAPNPFTPAGTGTVIDNATDEDGKEFYTIMTPSENVFYLIIDKQREQENVYFLNAVTEKDLLALAEKSEETEEPAEPATPATSVTPEPTLEPAPEPEKDGNGMMIVVVLVLLAGGGAGYYFKVYRPKQERANNAEDDYSEYEDDPYAEQEDDGPPWNEDEDEAGADSEDGEA
ncbi:DUF4366 domain-containing protein [Paenibacillus sp. HN-1]|uniref:DUF4366 domain-containing protein n=1 Tax=Paenibacillus TaxID=44249 RepID=UPI001CA94E0B|nr:MULTISPECIES: DUF4366 domain-containing protein [Paenibacillus]MBY9077764.1 DUF4366 domain-containing protein [Paenibacillus sp. CGMCC 1.18879]MBY9083657.1 DUF4366 domain-containing protein [Paenibacillus sinensis]